MCVHKCSFVTRLKCATETYEIVRCQRATCTFVHYTRFVITFNYINYVCLKSVWSDFIVNTNASILSLLTDNKHDVQSFRLGRQKLPTVSFKLF